MTYVLKLFVTTVFAVGLLWHPSAAFAKVCDEGKFETWNCPTCQSVELRGIKIFQTTDGKPDFDSYLWVNIYKKSKDESYGKYLEVQTNAQEKDSDGDPKIMEPDTMSSCDGTLKNIEITNSFFSFDIIDEGLTAKTKITYVGRPIGDKGEWEVTMSGMIWDKNPQKKDTFSIKTMKLDGKNHFPLSNSLGTPRHISLINCFGCF